MTTSRRRADELAEMALHPLGNNVRLGDRVCQGENPDEYGLALIHQHDVDANATVRRPDHVDLVDASGVHAERASRTTQIGNCHVGVDRLRVGAAPPRSVPNGTIEHRGRQLLEPLGKKLGARERQ